MPGLVSGLVGDCKVVLGSSAVDKVGPRFRPAAIALMQQ